MKPQFVNIQTYEPRSHDVFLFDTNILVFLFGPSPNTREVQAYSKAFTKIRSKKNTIVVLDLALCEYVHCCSSQYYDMYKQNFRTFKEFRNSEQFKLCSPHICDSIQKILRVSKVLQVELSNSKVSDFADEFSSSKGFDFNDLIMLDFCAEQNFVFVTDDSDFDNLSRDVQVLTNNPALL